MTSELENKIISTLSRWNEGVCPGGQILIEKGGDLLLDKSFGYANLENQIPVTRDSIFHIASVSKQFTVMSILLLQQEGKLSLDDPVDRYLGDLLGRLKPYQEKYGSIRIRHLCNNTSGLRDIWELLQLGGFLMTDAIQATDAADLIRHQQVLNFPAGEKYLYSNTGFQLLAMIVEQLSGLSFPQFVRERIFAPLGMLNSRIRKDCHELIPRLALSYLDEGNEYFYYPLNYAISGPTAVNTCASDLIKVINEYQHPTLLTESNARFMLSPAHTNDGRPIEYCGGLMHHSLEGYDVIEHSGADAAYRANFFWLPEKDLKIILLSNTNTYFMQHKTHEIASIILQAGGEILPASASCSPSGADSASFFPAQAAVYVCEQEGVPHVIEVLNHENKLCVKRELTLTPLRLHQDQLTYRIGHLDELLQFSSEGLLHRTAASALKYEKARPLGANCIPCGKYRLLEQEEVTFEIECRDDLLYFSTRRNGRTPLYRLGDGKAVFSFGPEFVFSIQMKGDCLELNGDRVRHLLAIKK